MKRDDIQRITVFSTDFPYPAHRGGRADVWRRIVAFHRLGIAVQLVCFYDDLPDQRPSETQRAEVMRIVESLHDFPIRKGLWATARRLPHIAATPWHVVCRSLAAAAQRRLEEAIARFEPDALWCDGPWCGKVAGQAAQRLGTPLIYRSHNIEHIYMRRQAAAARSRRDRLAWTIACFGLERFERGLMRSADWIFDISSDDLQFWQHEGLERISWLPPLAESALSPRPPASAINDVVFLGNLTTPNNIRGVEWLVGEIRPLVLAARPGTRFLVAGSNPGAHVRELCDTEGVTLLANAPDALAVYASAKVLVNPVRTGSGTHVKAIEMLMMQAPIVTATQGTQGLPAELKALFRVADDAPAFAREIVAALDAPAGEAAPRALARRIFGIEGLRDALAALPALMAACPRSGA